MDMEQIECVLAVAQYASFTEASFRLARSQSSISKKIASLERELGVILFERNTRSITLTSAGADFVQRGERILAEYRGFLQSLQLDPLEQSLVIGYIYFGASQSIAPYIASFMLEHPEIKIETISSMTTPLVEMLLKGAVDVAIVSSMYLQDAQSPPPNFSRDNRFVSASISIDPYYLVTSDRHPFAARKVIDYQSICGEKLITLDRNMDVYNKAFEHVFIDEHITPLSRVKCGSIADALRLVSENVGVALFSAQVISGQSGIAQIPLERPMVRDSQILIRNEKHAPKQIRSFYDFLVTNYAGGAT